MSIVLHIWGTKAHKCLICKRIHTSARNMKNKVKKQ